MLNAITIAPEILTALSRNKPIVALESTLIAHGLPWPENLQTAQDAEQRVRDSGATPATVAVLSGQIHVGLNDQQLLYLAQVATAIKAGRRDLAAVLARRADAATTVSATLWIARNVGIGVFATGGLGGVHRDAARTFDISNDLDELAKADGVVVVCSGVKTILDVPATLEALETLGVLVVGYQTETFPAFTCLSSGIPMEQQAASPAEAAAIAANHRALRLPGAIVLAQPVPSADALDRDEFDAALADALDQAMRQGVSGKALTPYLLDHIRRSTSGRSLHANRSLIVANAALAGEVAVAMAR